MQSKLANKFATQQPFGSRTGRALLASITEAKALAADLSLYDIKGRRRCCGSYCRFDFKRTTKFHKDAIVIDLMFHSHARREREVRSAAVNLDDIAIAALLAMLLPSSEIEPLSQIRILGSQLFG